MTDREFLVKSAELCKKDYWLGHGDRVLIQEAPRHHFIWNPFENRAQAEEVLEATNLQYEINKDSREGDWYHGVTLFDLEDEVILGCQQMELSKAICGAVKEWMEVEK